MEKKNCFQALILVYNGVFSCFSWRLEQAASAAVMLTAVSESTGQSKLDVLKSKAKSTVCVTGGTLPS